MSASSSPTKLKALNGLIGGLFLLTGIVVYATSRDLRTAAIWLALGLGYMLMDIYWLGKGQTVADVPPVSRWRRIASATFLAIALLLFVWQVAADWRAKQKREAAQTGQEAPLRPVPLKLLRIW